MCLPNGLLAPSRGSRWAAVLVVLLAVSAGVADAAESKARRCALIDLGTLGGRSSEAVAVNDRGWVAGNSVTADGGTHAFLWTARQGMVDLDTRGPYTTSLALAVNDRGQVAGSAYDNIGQAHGFLWTSREGMVDLPFVAHRALFITGFSNRGQMVGTRYGTNSALAFSWTARGGTVDLNLGGRVNEAYAVNERGQVIGASDVGSPPEYHAFLWSARDGMLDLGLISVRALNDRGEIAGGNGHAFLRTARGELIDLGTLGGTSSAALAVNDSGRVAGISDTTDGGIHAFAWTARRGMVDLGTLGGRNSSPTAMNQRGDVIGNSDTADGTSHAFLWRCPSPH